MGQCRKSIERKMLEKNGHDVHTVIIERIDRLARDLMIQETILDDFKKSGISIISVTDGDLLEDNPTRKLVRQVLGAIAEYDKEMTVQKLRVARNRKKASTGKKCEGRKSYHELNPELINFNLRKFFLEKLNYQEIIKVGSNYLAIP